MSHQRVIAYYVLDKLISDYHLGRNCIYSEKGWISLLTVNKLDVTMECHLFAQPTYTAFNMG